MLPKIMKYAAEESLCLECEKSFFKKMSFPQQKYCSKNCQSRAATSRWVCKGINKYGRFIDIPAIRRGNSALKKRFYNLKSCAKTRGILVALTFEEYESIVSSSCHWCDGELPKTGGGIDRLDNSIGYSFDNCVPCCTQCNIAKGCLSSEDFLVWLTKVYQKVVCRG